MKTSTLGELEEALGAVAEFLEEFSAPAGAGREERIRQALDKLQARPNCLTQIPELLTEMYQEIRDALDTLRMGKSELKGIAADRLSSTNAKLIEVSNATESAATAMLDQLDRALALVDDIDASRGDDSTSKTRKLREELHGLISALQFQDITSQQLRHASSLIEDLEVRLNRVLGVFGATPTHEEHSAPPPTEAETFDPEATTLDPEARQAMVDSIFG